MLVAQAKAMALCHEMVEGGKIGPAPNISLAYPASCKPEDQLAAQNLNAIRNWLYLDMAVYGEYNHLAWAFMEKVLIFCVTFFLPPIFFIIQPNKKTSNRMFNQKIIK